MILRRSDREREFTWCLIVMPSGCDTEVEFYETEADAQAAALTAYAKDTQVFVAHVKWQST